MSDKDWRSIVEAIVPGFRRVAIVRVENDRALDPERLAAEVRNVSASARVEVYPSVEAGLRGCANSKQLVITGSLYVVGEAMQSMGLAPGVTPDPLPLVEKLTPPSPAQ